MNPPVARERREIKHEAAARYLHQLEHVAMARDLTNSKKIPARGSFRCFKIHKRFSVVNLEPFGRH
jgi:hypothetical protein